MSSKLSLGLVIGGAVSSTLGGAFNKVGSHIKGLHATAGKMRILQSTIGDTIRLRAEWQKAHAAGEKGAGKLLGKLESNLAALREQGVEVRNLSRAYQTLGSQARRVDLRESGLQKVNTGIAQGKSAVGDALKLTAAVAVPATISANYNAIIRDIAIKAGVAGTDQEREMSRAVIDTSRGTGMQRNDAADMLNQLVAAGMDLREATQYLPTAAKFAIGQGAESTDTAKMLYAMRQNAGITDAAEIQKALEAIAYQGQAGSFEANDMARWMPELLAEMGNKGIRGLDAVNQIGSMLQVQMKTAGSADQAANNLKNWFSKIGSGETVKNYGKAGFDYQKSMDEAIGKGMSTLEASFELARAYIQKTDPAKAQAMSSALEAINKEADPAKVKAMTAALEENLKTGDLFNDMQVKSALTAYMQGRGLYQQLKAESANANGILEKNLAERREASAQLWSEVGQAWNDSLRSMGDALAPFTDGVGEKAKQLGQGLTALVDEFPKVIGGVIALAGGLVVLKSAVSAWTIARGALDLARSIGPIRSRRGRSGSVGGDRLGSPIGGAIGAQPVFVTNWPGGGLGGSLGDVPGGRDRASGSRRAGRGGWAARAGRGSVTGLKAGAPMAVIAAGAQAWDTYQYAETTNEKAAGYGEAAGNLAGTLAGAAAGAAVGSMVPVIGTVIGGLIGGALGAWGGGELGQRVGVGLFGEDEAAAPLAPVSLLASRSPPQPSLGEVVRAMSAAPPPPVSLLVQPAPAEQSQPREQHQTNTFAPQVAITVQGDVKDPRAMANDLMPHLQRMFADYQAQQQANSLFDAPNL
ncbi:phage tail tape measure protein [Pseudomonas sp. NPDC086581]|uniref:phage tail tape measure protein n=1 Tax=Pseudomonas sp. NPDC086581 TaxID=3364432 RepID=UPI00381027F8